MFKIIIQKKGAGDKAVTANYLSIIKKGCERAGAECEYAGYKQSLDKRNDVIITDVAQIALYYMLRGYKNNIAWYQGVVPEESYMRNNSTPRYIIHSLIEFVTLRKCRLIFLVSTDMLKHYEKKYRVRLGDKATIMPCFNECNIYGDSFSEEDKYRNNTFVYVGSLKAWQCFEETIYIYKEIEKRAESPTKFFVYTMQIKEAEDLLDKYGVKNYEVSYVCPDKLNEALKTIKYGFVLREDTAVNNVATPTKLSNYLANGIIPIYSNSLHSYDEFNRDNSFGIACDLNDTETSIRNILEHMETEISVDTARSKCLAVFDEYYNPERYINKIAEKILLFSYLIYKDNKN